MCFRHVSTNESFFRKQVVNIMTHDVFISFSFQDQEQAEEIVNILSSKFQVGSVHGILMEDEDIRVSFLRRLMQLKL